MNFDIGVIDKLIVIIINAFGLFLGGWVLIADRKATLNRRFIFMTVACLLWVSFAYLGFSSKNSSLAIFWYKLNIVSTLLTALTFYYFFILSFLQEERKHLILDNIFLAFVGILILLTVFTDTIVNSARIGDVGMELIYGKYGGIYYIFSFSFLLIMIFWLIKKYFSLLQQEKLRAQYFLIGILLWFSFNIIFNIFTPLTLNTTKYQHFGDYSIIFLLGFTAYAIVSRGLFGIRVILTQFLVGVVAILLLAQSITAIPNWLEFSWKFVLFLLFLFFGYLLIRSVMQEIQRRAELQRLYEEVDRLSRAKSEFISIASHQLRTPLTAIKGYISMLIEGTYGKFEERGKKPLENVYQSNERLINLVNDLLNVSRLESGTLKLELEKTSLENMISSVLDELRIKADEKNIYLKWEKAPSTGSGQALPEINIDPGKLRQVIMNIIDNCIKYTEKGGVTVTSQIKRATSKAAQGLIMIEIRDTGEGMEKGEIEHLFESFSRGQAGEKLWTGGSGLGLYVARKFVEMHDGKVWAESEGLGKGSAFFIELPVK